MKDFIAFSPANPSSIRNCIESARNNARAVRTALTMEMWDAINGAWLELKRYGNGPSSREEFSRFLRWVQETSMLFDGAAYRTMLEAFFLAEERTKERLADGESAETIPVSGLAAFFETPERITA